MPSWEETKAHLERNFEIAAKGESWLGLVWSFPGADQPIPQRERVELAKAFGQPHILLLADVGPASIMDPATALAHNMSLACGSLAVTKGTLVVKQLLPLGDLSLSQLSRSLEYVAHEVARLRSQLQRDETADLRATS